MKLEKIEITPEEIISVNQAIFLLNQSNSDHADQCLCYLKKLAAKMSQAKIIKGVDHAI